MPDRSPRPPVHPSPGHGPHGLHDLHDLHDLRTDAAARPPARRRILAGLAIALVAVLGATSCTPAVSPTSYRRIVHELTLPAFARWWQTEHRVATSTWDLSTDGCSFAPDRGLTFDFRWPCTRHDLAWRNVRRLSSRPSIAQQRRLKIEANERFRRDLATACAQRATWQQASCRGVADIYHRAVVAVT